MVKRLVFCALDSESLSGGLLTTWSPHYRAFSASLFSSEIMVDLEERFLNSSFWLVNVYGPYADRLPFWEGLSESRVTSSSNIILGGDLKLMLSIREVWGAHPHRDAQEGLFSHWI